MCCYIRCDRTHLVISLLINKGAIALAFAYNMLLIASLYQAFI
ncbi:hypothetical protein [Nostoc sp.]